MLFYMSEVLKLPQKVWARTSAGTVTHAILDVLARDKHREYHNIVKMAGTLEASSAISRLLKMWIARLKITPDIAADIDPMCLLAINETNFLDEGAIRTFEPEHEFRMTLKNGAIVKGFIDRMAEFPHEFVITDYKTARNKKTKEEVLEAFQSLVYQLYVWKTFDKLASVRYLFLRHPPTKRAPDKHIMVTPPATPAQLAGFESYLEHMFEVINRFGPDEARAKYHMDSGFCDRVCSYRTPRTYLSIKKRGTNALVGNFLPEHAPELKADEWVEELKHKGCPRYNSP